ncbi:MAG: cell surface protein SprA [bacterium]
MRPHRSATRFLAVCALVGAAFPGLLHAQASPPDTPKRRADSTRVGTLVLPGDLPVQLNLRATLSTERDRNLRCTSLEAGQISSISGCGGGFLPPTPDFKFAIKSAGMIGDQLHINIDYDAQREFDASNVVSLYYQGKPTAHLQRVDVGNITFAPPPSRFITSSLPSGNYGAQTTWQFGKLNLKTIFARQTGNIVQSQTYDMAQRSEQRTGRDIADYQIERLRFFFTVDPALFGRAFPNVDILNRNQLSAIRSSLPDTLRPTRVLLYRLQFGAQPQNPNGPKFILQGDPPGRGQTYDLLREGVDYILDPSQLWFALVRPLNENNERLVVAYNVRLNGRDTTWVTTGGTPDLQATTAHVQVANLVMDPSVGPTSPAFRREIRSVYRLGGENLVRRSVQVRIVTGSGLLEHPIAGNDATFLQMFGLAQSTNPSEFDFENRIWPRVGDPAFNLGAGAADIRNGQSLDIARIIRDYFIVFPSARPFAQRDSGLVVAGNPTNSLIYSTPGEYLYSTQHPASVYRLSLKYETSGADDGGVITLGATQMRPGSERVLLEGRPLVRDLDYRIDYDLGRIDFLRPDTLFALPRRVEVRYEDNPSFAATPITLAGVVSEIPVSHGLFTFTAINQSQSTQFTRPQLGFQGNSMLTAGVTGQFNWEAPALTRLVSALPFGKTTATSHFSLQGEVASSRPQFLAKNNDQAFIESFEGSSGISIALGDGAWYYSSLPAYGHTLRAQLGPGLLETNHAATLAWQTYPITPTGRRIQFTRSNIDPLTVFAGTGAEFPEPVLWLSLLPLGQGGQYNRATKQFNWTVGNRPPGQRWRSIRTVLSPAGLDLTSSELLEFWALVDTNVPKKNATLVFDFGDISENSLSFAPETLTIVRNGSGKADSTFTGKTLQGFDRLDSERDPFSHAFNADVNDTGLPGDVVDSLIVIDGGMVTKVRNVRICRSSLGTLEVLGDPRANCTAGNARLDEEDIDQDNSMNFFSNQRESERLLRYVVDLGDPTRYKRLGGSYTDTLIVNGVSEIRTRRWALVSIPFKTPTDSLNDVNRRRIRALRLTVVSGSAQTNDEATQFPIAELHVTGAPWLARSNTTLAGVAGRQLDVGFVIASSIGTNDSSAAVVYQPPPGVVDQTDTKSGQLQVGRTQINEHSMRIQAGNMPLYRRAEAFFRFPSGPQFLLGFRQLRVWGRGRGNGWGQNGDLQMFVKVGRDENNFYLYRAPMEAGQTQAAWTDLGIDFNRFVALRNKIGADYLAGKKESISCTGADSAIIAASPLPVGVVSHRFAACDNGYMVYTVDPAVSAPNLASVQELAVGMIRMSASGGASAILPGDTLELWVDDIRATQPLNSSGVAGQVGMTATIADLADLRINVSNRDPNFRQLGDQPTFLSERNIDVASTVHLEKLLPKGFGISLPLTIVKVSTSNDPLYLTGTDVLAKGINGVRKPRNDQTTYSLTARRTTPVNGGVLGPLLNNLSATTSYSTGIDRTEYQNGDANNFTFGLDYLVTDDSARALHVPSWLDGLMGALPSVLQAGPVSAFRQSAFRWNPTQLRFTSGIARGTDRRVSFIQPAGTPDDQPSVSSALSQLWRNGSVLELRPTNGLSLRWELQSIRDLRDYADSSAFGAVPTPQRQRMFGANTGFERERSMFSSFSFTPTFSAWLRPRADLGTQYSMLRDPNVRSLGALPGVVGVDSVLAARDSAATASFTNLPRRMTAAQTGSVGTTIDLAKAFAMYTRDSSVTRRLGGVFAPVDVSYTRSLLSALDAAPVGAPLLLQLGLGGPASFRHVNGVDATTAGETGTVNATTALLLPLGTSLVNRYRRTTTLNWISRPDDQSQAQVDGAQTVFPDVAVRWQYHPAAGSAVISNVDANVGYVRSDATVSLPSLFNDSPPEIRHTHVETFPVGGTVVWAGRGAMSTGARYSQLRQVDSLPGSIARTSGKELSVDASRAFHIPESWGLGLRSDLRTRLGIQNSHRTTFVFDPTGAVQSRLQDNGRTAFNLTADTNVQDNVVFTFLGSHVITFDNNLNRRFEQTLFSTVLQIQFFGAGK